MGVLLLSMKLSSLILSDSRIKKLSDICSDLGMVLVASVALPGILGTFDIISFVTGSVLAVLCFLVSLQLLK